MDGAQRAGDRGPGDLPAGHATAGPGRHPGRAQREPVQLLDDHADLQRTNRLLLRPAARPGAAGQPGRYAPARRQRLPGTRRYGHGADLLVHGGKRRARPGAAPLAARLVHPPRTGQRRRRGRSGLHRRPSGRVPGRRRPLPPASLRHHPGAVAGGAGPQQRRHRCPHGRKRGGRVHRPQRGLAGDAGRHREHRGGAARRRADLRPPRGQRAARHRVPPRSAGKRGARGGGRRRPHALRRKPPGGHPAPQGQDPRHPAGAPPGRAHRPLLRPHPAHPGSHRHGDRHSAGSHAHRHGDDPAHPGTPAQLGRHLPVAPPGRAVLVRAHVPAGRTVQHHVAGRAGHLHRRAGRQLHRHGGKRLAPPGAPLRRPAHRGRHPGRHPPRVPHSRPADLLLHHHHAHLLPAGLRAVGDGRPHVPPAGLDQVAGHDRRGAAGHHAGASLAPHVPPRPYPPRGRKPHRVGLHPGVPPHAGLVPAAPQSVRVGAGRIVHHGPGPGPSAPGGVPAGGVARAGRGDVLHHGPLVAVCHVCDVAAAGHRGLAVPQAGTRVHAPAGRRHHPRHGHVDPPRVADAGGRRSEGAGLDPAAVPRNLAGGGEGRSGRVAAGSGAAGDVRDARRLRTPRALAQAPPALRGCPAASRCRLRPAAAPGHRAAARRRGAAPRCASRRQRDAPPRGRRLRAAAPGCSAAGNARAAGRRRAGPGRRRATGPRRCQPPRFAAR